MAQTKFRIVKGDEETVVALKPKHMLKIEREYKDLEPIESTYHMAWMASGEDVDFDTWIDGVDDIIPILPEGLEDEAEEEVPPTTAASRRSRS